jgi:hypothetical protein
MQLGTVPGECYHQPTGNLLVTPLQWIIVEIYLKFSDLSCHADQPFSQFELL